MPEWRLDKLIAQGGKFTRKQVKELCRRGEISVGGKAVKSAQEKVNPEKETILIRGEKYLYKPYLYLMLNKPRGIVSASEDKRDTTVIDLVPEKWRRPGLFPAGRLDKDSEGFVLITDDGGFAHRILSKKSHVTKTYHVTVDGEVTEEMVHAFESGVTLADGKKCMEASLKILKRDGALTKTEVILRQGLYHQIKRMFGVYRCAVVRLFRVRIGGLTLDSDLAPGQCRELSEEQIRQVIEES